MRWMSAEWAMRAAGLVLAFGLAEAASASPLDDVTEALDRKDFATVVRLLKPLADQGNAIEQYELDGMTRA